MSGATDSAAAILLNGCSSSGKSTLSLALQEGLPGRWVLFAMDQFLQGLPSPPADPTAADVAEYARLTGHIDSGARDYIAGLVTEGVPVILDWVCQRGAADIALWRRSLGNAIVCVNVKAPLDVLEARERARPDRVAGIARFQHPLVHAGYEPDIEVDTHALSPALATETVVAAVTARLGAHPGTASFVQRQEGIAR